jgi:murein tripeptide amidase MpaA
MGFGSWNITSLCRVDAIKSVVGEFEMYELDLVGVQEVRWEGEGYQKTHNYTFYMEKGMLITNWGQDFLYIKE